MDEPKAGRKQHVFTKHSPLHPALLEHRHKYKPRAFSVWHAADLSNEAKNFRLSCDTNLDISISFIRLRDSAKPAGWLDLPAHTRYAKTTGHSIKIQARFCRSHFVTAPQKTCSKPKLSARLRQDVVDT